jgi:hypothetical protein
VRLVVPHTNLRQETYRATRNWPNVTYRYVGDSETAYSELVCELWEQGETFALVEHDIVVAKGMLDRLARCDQPMCAHPYEWTTNIGPALGCNRFSAQLLADFPDAANEAAAIDGGHGAGSWRTFDYWLTRTILEEKYGQVAHLHLPPVEHLNKEKQLLPIYRDRPLATHLRHVGYELSPDGHSARWVGRMRRAVQPPPAA